VALAVVAATTGCISSARRAAEDGDRATLQRAIEAQHRAGTLSDRKARDLAEGVLRFEIAHARGGDALERVREVRSCAADLDAPLAERMRVHDGAGAEAAGIRLEIGEISRASARSYAADPVAAWRAVGVRALVEKEDSAARLRGLVDPDPAVRRSAVHAIAEAASPAELDALFEALRVDPEPMVRTDAARAVPQLSASAPLGVRQQVSDRLRDAWNAADEFLREDIAKAWVSEPLLEAGGGDALALRLASKPASGVLEAAAQLLRVARGPEGLRAASVALLRRAIEMGPLRDRLHALAVAPLGNADLLAAVKVAAKNEDPEVSRAALARLTEDPKSRQSAVQALEAWASPNAPPAVAARVQLALAQAGDVRIQAWIEARLLSSDPRDRMAAASALSALGRAARAAPLLVDADAAVRTRVACGMLVAARFKR